MQHCLGSRGTKERLTCAADKGFVVIRREERDGQFSEVALEHAGHSGNVHLLAHIEQRVPPCTQQAHTDTDTQTHTHHSSCATRTQCHANITFLEGLAQLLGVGCRSRDPK